MWALFFFVKEPKMRRFYAWLVEMTCETGDTESSMTGVTETSIHTALSTGSAPAVIHAIVEKTPSIVTTRDDLGRLPLFYATKCSADVVTALCKGVFYDATTEDADETFTMV
jgi:hypothetical protein